ncbi:MAG: hypothetical protein KGL18_05375 [Burkholderiales bacterium]|nr:hypothetical protein [Burkholderiales bacterium]MDE1926670.1 hypothetical protein [Burkholderiales bacterium]MDE2158111.1 hypothetical protein [Burkholderiales bacterium]MDE2502391.1 hypothetical protein [Burkholderiales bacterium]
MPLLRYFAALPRGKLVLWCYLIWYLVTAVALFDPAPSLWLSSAGISLVIGYALRLSVERGAATDRWQRFRLYFMPFAVSSFSSMIKGQPYLLIFPRRLPLLAASIGACLAFIAFVGLCRRLVGPRRAT